MFKSDLVRFAKVIEQAKIQKLDCRGAWPWFETRSFAALLTMRLECFAAGRMQGHFKRHSSSQLGKMGGVKPVMPGREQFAALPGAVTVVGDNIAVRSSLLTCKNAGKCEYSYQI